MSKKNKQKPEETTTEVMFSVKSTGLIEASLEKVFVVNDRVVEREFITKDLIELVHRKMWLAVYKDLTNQRNTDYEPIPTNRDNGNNKDNRAII